MDRVAGALGNDVGSRGSAARNGALARPSRLLNNAVSPFGLAFLSYAFFLFSCLIPPSIYQRYMMEPDFMFLDPATILFYTLSVASFLIGAGLIAWVLPSSFINRKITT